MPKQTMRNSQIADARGYAIIDRHGKILTRTVAPEHRGAIVNWLFTYARVRIMDNWPDEMVQKTFDTIKAEHGVRVAEVIISEITS